MGKGRPSFKSGAKRRSEQKALKHLAVGVQAPGRIAPREPRVMMFDIEATGLNATFGSVLCIGWKWLHETRVHCPTILDHKHAHMLDDKALIEAWAYGPLEKADYVVGWYSGAGHYDLPMLKARAIKYRLPPFPPVVHIDLWREWRKQFKTHNNRLATVSEFLKTDTQKTPIDFEAWQHAAHGDTRGMAEVVKHCKADVLALEQVFLKMRPWLDVEPSRALFTGKKDCCPSCGSEKLYGCGVRTTQATVYRLRRCEDCGKYVRGARGLDRSEWRNTI